MHLRTLTLTSWLAGAMLLSVPASAQTAQMQFTLTSDQPTAQFFIDGTPYYGSASVTWQVGSKHSLEVRNVIQTRSAENTRLLFSSWLLPSGEDLPGALQPTLIIPADPDMPAMKVLFKVQHQLCVEVPGGSNPDAAIEVPSPLGVVYVNGVCQRSSKCGWADEDSSVKLAAFPMPGVVFQGWSVNGVVNLEFAATFPIKNPITVVSAFAIASRVQLYTTPPGLKVSVNGNVMDTWRADAVCRPKVDLLGPPPLELPQPNPACPIIPLCTGDLDVLPGSDLTLGAPPIQTDEEGKYWALESWNVGSGPDTVWKVPATPSRYQITGRFVRGARFGIFTQPDGLKYKVDGKEYSASTVYVWGIGQKHTLSAPAEQVDAKGRRYRFAGWSNGGSADQEIVVSSSDLAAGLNVVARYQILGQLTLRTDPPGLPVRVDGTECRTPCTLDRPVGSEAVIQPVTEIPTAPDTRIDFTGWYGGGPAVRVYTFTEAAGSLVALYQTLVKLTLLSDPADGVNFLLDPAPSPEGYYTAGIRVQIAADPKLGFRFRRWEGALSGTALIAALDMRRPATVLAQLDRVPSLPKNAVRNAAAKTPVEGVAAGSLVLVEGIHLAPVFHEAPVSPLAMTLEGVMMTVGDRTVPLAWVSPESIRAQVPTNLPEGEHVLVIRGAAQPEVTTTFTVVRNAPGLFETGDGDIKYAEAYHQNGKPVTSADPARVGETVSFVGTGFGPTNPQPLEGFLSPAGTEAKLVDNAEVLVGGQVFPPVSATASTSKVGAQVLKLQINAAMGTARNLEVVLRVNGRLSNQVLLPVQ